MEDHLLVCGPIDGKPVTTDKKWNYHLAALCLHQPAELHFTFMSVFSLSCMIPVRNMVVFPYAKATLDVLVRDGLATLLNQPETHTPAVPHRHCCCGGAGTAWRERERASPDSLPFTRFLSFMYTFESVTYIQIL